MTGLSRQMRRGAWHFCIFNGYEARSKYVFCKQIADWYNKKIQTSMISHLILNWLGQTNIFWNFQPNWDIWFWENWNFVSAVCLQNTYLDLASYPFKIQKYNACLHVYVCLDEPVIPDYSLFFQASCLLIYSHKCKQKETIKIFEVPNLAQSLSTNNRTRYMCIGIYVYYINWIDK